MRVNVYAEEMTEQVEIITKENDDGKFTGVRFYLHLPVTVQGKQIKGPFIHKPGDDDSSAVTFWGKQDLRLVLRKALLMLDLHYEKLPSPPPLDTLNRFAVTASSVKVLVGIPPSRLEKKEAVMLAAWLVAMADMLDGECPTFEEALAAVQNC